MALLSQITNFSFNVMVKKLDLQGVIIQNFCLFNRFILPH